jgi:hypothetical protein
MIYRARTKQGRYEGREVFKTASMGFDLDAIVVEKKDVESFVEKGWFASIANMVELVNSEPVGNTKKAKSR